MVHSLCTAVINLVLYCGTKSRVKRSDHVRLKDKVAIITGAGSGIGRESALLFAKEGAKVVVAERDEANGQETVRLIEEQNGTALFVKTDVTDEDSVQNMVDETVKAFGKIDV